MKIVPIFAIENKREGLFSIQLLDENDDEVSKCIDLWLFNNKYLYEFFTLHQNDLNSGYYGETISIQDAVDYTRREAEILFDKLEQLAYEGLEEGYQNLSSAFYPLHNEEYRQTSLQKVKAKTGKHKKWLRLYAIKIGPNTFIVTGGAIKLVEKMNESDHLKVEKNKLEKIRTYLQDQGIIDQEDFNIYEI